MTDQWNPDSVMSSLGESLRLAAEEAEITRQAREEDLRREPEEAKRAEEARHLELVRKLRV